MKDKILIKFMRSWKFQRMPKNEQMLELQDYAYQKRNFKAFSK